LVLRELTKRYGVDLVVNERMNLTLAVEADGVHVGQEDLPPDIVRKLVGDKMYIGYSVKSIASRSTVYRTVRLLQEFGAIREVIKLGNRTIYEFVAGKPHHEHLICVECGKIIEFYKEEIEELQDRVCEEYDFTPLNHRLEVFGLCSECKGKRHESGRLEARA